MPRRQFLSTVWVGLIASAAALGQLSTGGSSVYQPAPSYSSYYSQQLQTYRRPSVSPRQYTVDNYFYHRPTVSPYLNLTRRSGGYTNNYYQYVQPEVARRQATVGTSGTAAPPRPPAAGNAYYNQWYGQRQQMGLR